jgi:hypothetical protein
MKECSPDIMLLACSARVLGVVDLVNRHRSSAACGTLFGTEGTHTSARTICALKRTPSYHHFTCSSLLMSPLNSCQFWSHYQFVLHACCCSILHEEEPYLAGLDHTDHFIYQVPRTPGLPDYPVPAQWLLSYCRSQLHFIMCARKQARHGQIQQTAPHIRHAIVTL